MGSGNKSALERFREKWPAEKWSGLTTLVGVSGGTDSVALLRLLCEVRDRWNDLGTGPQVRLVVAHFDHQWREDSQRDADFVRQLAKSLSTEFVLGVDESCSATAPEKTAADKTEQRARSLRYDFLVRAAKENAARIITVAHTADDQVETILHHAIRGTGLRGLAGIPPTRHIDEALSIVRPLLGFRRKELTAYLRSLGQSFRVDPSNADTKYTRAKIRHELLPALRDFKSEVDDALLRLGNLASEATAEIGAIAKALLLQATITPDAASVVRSEEASDVAFKESIVVLSIPALKSASPFLIREALLLLWRERDWPLQDMSQEKWHSLAKLVCDGDNRDDNRSVNLPGNIIARVTDAERLEIRVHS